MSELGSLLRAARARRALDLCEVSRTTKIPVHHLEALEAGSLEALPRGYARPLARSYARALGVDATHALACAAPERPQPAAQTSRAAPARASLSPLALVAAVVMLVLVLFVLVARESVGRQAAPGAALSQARQAADALRPPDGAA